VVSYKNGDRYQGICFDKEREANIILSCNPENSDEIIILFEGNDLTNESCYHFFEIRTPIMCSSDNFVDDEYVHVHSHDYADHNDDNVSEIFKIFKYFLIM
jgi:hypothetical protein